MQVIEKQSPYGGVYYTFPDGSRAPEPFRALTRREIEEEEERRRLAWREFWILQLLIAQRDTKTPPAPSIHIPPLLNGFAS
jgi:hypothetical protein